MSNLRKVVYEKIQNMGRLDLWPSLRVELMSIEQQDLTEAYLAAAKAGRKCKNEANSWVAWVLGICDDEPDGPMSMINTPGLADIDSDFDRDRRDEIIKITAEKFGEENVAHIGTYGQYKLKAALQSVLKFRGVHPQTAINISKCVPFNAKTVDEAVAQNEALAEHLRKNPGDRDIIDRIIGAYSNIGMHAAGIVIAPKPIYEIAPMACTNKGMVTAVDLDDIEGMGLVKFDFLGLANVTTISTCLKLVKERRGIDVDLTTIPMRLSDCKTEDERNFLRLCIMKFDRCEVDTIFQFETPGFVDVLGQMDITNFDDLVAVMSLNRPGAKKFVSRSYYERYRKKFPDDKGPADPENSPIGNYSDNRNDPDSISSPHPALQPILAETYGIPIYQEQALRIIQALSGATLAEADTLRRAIGKKKEELFQKCRRDFIDGCKNRNIDDDVIQQVWQLLEEFDKYSFNKAHSCAYTTIAWWNMYLRQRFTPEWYAAVMTTEFNQGSSKKKMLQPERTQLYSRSKRTSLALLDGTKLGWYRQGAKNIGVDILLPNVNESDYQDAKIIDDHTVIMPLCSIMHIGANAQCVAAAKKYQDIDDLVRRSGAPKSLLQTLIEAGACNDLFRSNNGPEVGLSQLDISTITVRESRRAEEARAKKTNARTDAGSLFENIKSQPGLGVMKALKKSK